MAAKLRSPKLAVRSSVSHQHSAQRITVANQKDQTQSYAGFRPCICGLGRLLCVSHTMPRLQCKRLRSTMAKAIIPARLLHICMYIRRTAGSRQSAQCSHVGIYRMSVTAVQRICWIIALQRPLCRGLGSSREEPATHIFHSLAVRHQWAVHPSSRRVWDYAQAVNDARSSLTMAASRLRRRWRRCWSPLWAAGTRRRTELAQRWSAPPQEGSVRSGPRSRGTATLCCARTYC